MLQAHSAEVIGFESLTHDYPTCRAFGEIYTLLLQDPATLVKCFTIVYGFLFRGRLCIPNTSLRS